MGVSEEVARKIDIKLENITYNEEGRVIIPSSGIVKRNAEYIKIQLDKVKSFASGYFDIDEICAQENRKDIGDMNNRPFYTTPFLIDAESMSIAILNISLLPAFGRIHMGLRRKL